MSDNADTGNESSKNQMHFEAEQPTNKKITPVQPDKVPANHSGKNIEVHQFKVEKKKFKEYFLEFSMIFLAVTLGFFADNVRDHFAEKKNEKEYVHSLLQDLRSDSSSFNRVIAYNERDIKNIDTSIRLLNGHLITDSVAKILYYSHKVNPYFHTQDFNQRTISQLKSAGGFRLISNQKVSDSIVRYDIGIERAAWLREELLNALKNDRESGYSIFNDFLVADYRSVNGIDILHSSKKFKLLTTEENVLIPYANKLKMRLDWLESYNSTVKTMKRRCNNLIQLIESEY